MEHYREASLDSRSFNTRFIMTYSSAGSPGAFFSIKNREPITYVRNRIWQLEDFYNDMLIPSQREDYLKNLARRLEEFLEDELHRR
jgi:hypothetical protein